MSQKKYKVTLTQEEEEYLPILPLLERDIPREESGPVIRGNGIRDSLKQRFQVF
jgi:hypothetical protein